MSKQEKQQRYLSSSEFYEKYQKSNIRSEKIEKIFNRLFTLVFILSVSAFVSLFYFF